MFTTYVSPLLCLVSQTKPTADQPVAHTQSPPGGTADLGFWSVKSETKVLQVPYGYMFVAEESNFRISHCQGHKNRQSVR